MMATAVIVWVSIFGTMLATLFIPDDRFEDAPGWLRSIALRPSATGRLGLIYGTAVVTVLFLMGIVLLVAAWTRLSWDPAAPLLAFIGTPGVLISLVCIALLVRRYR